MMVTVRLFDTREGGCETHVTSSSKWWTKNEVVFFLYFTHHGMNFHKRGIRYLSLFCTKIRNNPKQTKITQNKVMQRTTSNKRFATNCSLPCSQPGFGKPVINRRGFIYVDISKMGFTFWISARVQGSILTWAVRKTNIW